MNTNRNVANLSVAVVKTLVRMTPFAAVADTIDSAQEFLNLLADIKNNALDNPNAEMIRSLNTAVKSEIRSIEGALKQDGMSRNLIKEAVAQLSEAARDTIKELAEDDDALIRAVHQPKNFGAELKRHAARRSDCFSNNMQAHYTTLLDRISQEFLILAPWSPSFDRIALTSLLRCFPALSERIDRLEQHMDRRFDHIELGMREDRDIHIENNQLLKGLSSQNASPIFDHVIFGSRPDVVAGDCFVPRGEQEHLNALIADTTRRRTVLVGMRGCGKTQLASTLAQQCEDAHWKLVAWINAVSRESIQSDLVELAKELKIDTSDQPTPETIIRRLFNRLKLADPSDRLIVFDNVENIADLRRLVPSANGLRIVATTTNNTGWGHQGWDTIKVGVFGRDESINYLLTVTKSDDHDIADVLAKRLGDLPLAIAQAAGTARNKDLSLARYLQRLDSRGEELVIRHNPEDEYTVDAVKALLMAVKDTIEGLEGNTKETAQRQLGALALLAESGVPTRWLDPTVEQLDDDESPDTQRDTDEDAHDALTELIHRSIVHQSADKATTMLHRLQAVAFRESWGERERKQAYESASTLLGSVDLEDFPRNATDLLRRETRDLIEQLYTLSTQDHSCLLLEREEVRTCLRRVFRFAHELGLSYEALTLQPVVEILQDLLSSVHPEILALRSSLASLYESAGDTDEAIILHKRVLSDSICVLGEDHPVTLGARNSLASSYLSVGRLTEAITQFEQVLADSLRILGEDHPQTLIARINLAGAYDSAGRSDDAISLLEDVLSNSLRVFGEDHPYTLSARNNLASAYESAGQLSEAIAHFEQVLADSLRILGEDHPQTLSTRNNLASTYGSAGQLSAAITMQEQVLTDSIRVLGEDHPDTLISRNNLASAYESAGRTDEAITLHEQALTDSIRILGEDHPDTLISRNNLAGAYESAGRTDEAITLHEQALTDSIRILGEDHPHTLISRNNLAGAYESAGRTDEAITLYEQVLTDRSRVLGKDHPATLTSFHNLAGAYESAGRTDEAITLYEQVFTDRSRLLGEDHPKTLASRNNLAYTYLLMGRTEDAISHFKQTLIESTRALGEEHPLTVSACENLELAMHVLEQRKDDAPAE